MIVNSILQQLKRCQCEICKRGNYFSTPRLYFLNEWSFTLYDLLIMMLYYTWFIWYFVVTVLHKQSLSYCTININFITRRCCLSQSDILLYRVLSVCYFDDRAVLTKENVLFRLYILKDSLPTTYFIYSDIMTLNLLQGILHIS